MQDSNTVQQSVKKSVEASEESTPPHPVQNPLLLNVADRISDNESILNWKQVEELNLLTKDQLLHIYEVLDEQNDDINKAAKKVLITGLMQLSASHPLQVRQALNICITREWCECGSCGPMLRPEELRCCKKKSSECLATNPDIIKLIEKVDKKYESRKRSAAVMEEARSTAYEYIENYLHDGEPEKQKVKTILPSCIKWAVRERFRDPHNKYTGIMLSETTELD